MFNLSDNFKFSEYHMCGEDDPKEDGKYLVFRVYRSEYGYYLSYAMTYDFTLEYGWNANEKNPDTVIDFAESEDYLTFWTDVTYVGAGSNIEEEKDNG